MGICLCGDMDSVDNFTKRYYYPYFLGTGITSYADITIERRMDREAYVGICEDAKSELQLYLSAKCATVFEGKAIER